ncbi:hypothetical protein C8J57DRAFT_1536731 [Mycena rebaudengoi]|nr:hypothetical protein C8J57DRAFT_1536731 [Mycena rebaudengoi]
MPFEICDEHTASRLGWFNAARRSSILPENLITCARLYDLYTKRIAEGDYIHEAFVALDKALVPAETEHVNFNDPDVPAAARLQDVFAIDRPRPIRVARAVP